MKSCDRLAEITAVFIDLLLPALWVIPVAEFTTSVTMTEVTIPLADASKQGMYCASVNLS